MKSTYGPGNTRTCGEKRRGQFASRAMAEYPPQCAASNCGARVRGFDCIRSVCMGARCTKLRSDACYQNSGSQNCDCSAAACFLIALWIWDVRLKNLISLFIIVEWWDRRLIDACFGFSADWTHTRCKKLQYALVLTKNALWLDSLLRNWISKDVEFLMGAVLHCTG